MFCSRNRDSFTKGDDAYLLCSNRDPHPTYCQRFGQYFGDALGS